MSDNAETPWRAVRDTEMAAAIARACAEDPLNDLLQRAGAGGAELRAAIEARPRAVAGVLMFVTWRWRAARWRCKRQRRLMRIEKAGHRPWAVGLWLSEKLAQMMLLSGVGVLLITTALGALQLNLVLAGPEPSRLPDNEQCDIAASSVAAGVRGLLSLLGIAVLCGLVLGLSVALAGLAENHSSSPAKRQERVARADERCAAARSAWARALDRRFLEPVAQSLAHRRTPSSAALWRGVLVSMAKHPIVRATQASATLFRRARRVVFEVAVMMIGLLGFMGLLVCGGIAASSMVLATGLTFEWVEALFGAAKDTCLNRDPGLHLAVALATMLATGLLARWLVHRLDRRDR